MLLPVTNAKDVTAGRMTVEYIKPSGKRAVAARSASYVCLNAGSSPSYALVPAPMSRFGEGAWDETAPTCALMRTGPAGEIKGWTRAIVKYSTGSVAVPLMTGWVVTHTHNRKSMEDSVITQIFDDRAALAKFTCFGRLCYDPSLGKVYWDLASPQIFNQMNYPDLLDTPYGPLFAPCHRFGYKNDFADHGDNEPFEDFSEPDPGQATTRARSWRSQDVIDYLRNVHSANSGGIRPPTPVDVGQMELPEEIVWPRGLGSNFATDRAIRHYVTQGQSLLDVLQDVASKAGPWDLYIEPRSDGKGVISFLDMRPKDNAGIGLKTPDYAGSLAEAMNSGSVVKSFSITENFIDTYTDVCIVGDAPSVELMASTYSSGTGALILEPAWSIAEELAFKNYISRFGDDSSAFLAATRKWPMVYAAWRIKTSADLWGGTKWDGMKNGGRPRIKPMQLTGYQQDSSNPRNWQPREIIVEYLRIYLDEDTSYAGTPASRWIEAARYDNLTLSADGTIVFLSALRDNLQSWFSQNDGATPVGTYVGTKMSDRNIRIQMAVEADWPITGIAGKGGNAADDPNRVYDRMNQKPRFTWLLTPEPMQYVEYLRRGDSRPIGEANQDEVNDIFSLFAFPPRVAEGSELFTDRVNKSTGRLPDHARITLSDVKRVVVAGTMEVEALSVGMRPGLPVSLEGGDTLPCYGVTKSVVFRDQPTNADEGQTSIIFGPPEKAVLTSPPASGQATSSGGSYTQSSGGGYDEYDKPYQEEKPQTSSASSSANEDYERSAAGLPSKKPAAAAAPGKPLSRAENRKKNMEQKLAKMGEGEKGREGLEAKIRKEGLAVEREKGREAVERANEGARGAMIDAKGGVTKAGGLMGKNGPGFGEGSAGAARFANGQQINAGDIGKTQMFNTKAADAMSEASYRKGKEAENERTRKGIAGLTKKGGADLAGTKAAPKPAAPARMTAGQIARKDNTVGRVPGISSPVKTQPKPAPKRPEPEDE